jgi:hypothetical protein
MPMVGDCRLALVPEPENPYDGDAIAVKGRNGQQLGYLPAETACELAVAIRNRREVWAVVFRPRGSQSLER